MLLKFFASDRFLEASSQKLSSTIENFPSVDRNGMNNNVFFEKKLAEQNSKEKHIDALYEPLNLKRNHSKLKSSTINNEEKERTEFIN